MFFDNEIIFINDWESVLNTKYPIKELHSSDYNQIKENSEENFFFFKIHFVC
jgi:hypothetical protein